MQETSPQSSLKAFDVGVVTNLRDNNLAEESGKSSEFVHETSKNIKKSMYPMKIKP